MKSLTLAIGTLLATPILGTLIIFSIALGYSSNRGGNSSGYEAVNGVINSPMSLALWIGGLQLFTSSLYLLAGDKNPWTLYAILGVNALLLAIFVGGMAIGVQPAPDAGLVSWLAIIFSFPVWVLALVFAIIGRVLNRGQISPYSSSI